jgi:hypothetical protein
VNTSIPSINANRPDFEYMPGNHMWRVQLPGEEHLIRDFTAAKALAEKHGVLVDTKTQIVAAWLKAYAMWEAGRACSPSASDLIAISHEIDPNRFPEPSSDAADLMSEQLYHLQCEGLELDACFDALFILIPDQEQS